ncbi:MULTISPECIES: hypothetical protein [Fischerella]|uniref:hypothetical protein n=1 Tax=Fischerella sp. FACHB-380 TaxID=2692799 RepID=UPI00031E9442|nr:hypothetical protein [Fischerella sp. FACHB-380]
MQLLASIAGAQILVNTVSYVKGTLKLGDVEYGWVMAAFGIGATLSAVAFGAISQRFRQDNLCAVRCDFDNLIPPASKLCLC